MNKFYAILISISLAAAITLLLYEGIQQNRLIERECAAFCEDKNMLFVKFTNFCGVRCYCNDNGQLKKYFRAGAYFFDLNPSKEDCIS